ncbi:MAG: excinuclease ABC subunit UvrA, partial [Desulfobulbaceae bacterium]|nr:excinuclease ABC subunit UvrA [Desulfobulbaceae bacterium]
MEPQFIRIRGARMHNLKNIDVDLPRNQLVVFTGLSGSGKSSLAFDTLYAEGQRRYVESLSTYARQFLGQMDKPEVDLLEGLSPAVSIEQRTTSRNPRSTVGTITEIYDHLRLLFARVGRPHCPDCGKEIRPQSVHDMVTSLMARPQGTKMILLAPVVDSKKGEHQEVLRRLRKEGYVRVRVDGEIINLDEEIILEKSKRHSIQAVVDRLVVKESVARRLSDSVTTAVALADGFLLVQFPDSGEEVLFSERAACVQCGRSLPALSPQLFSFNNPKGACPECGGLGVKQFFDRRLVIPEPGRSIREGAIAPWGNPWLPPGKRRFKSHDDAPSMLGQMLAALAGHYGFSLDTPFGRLAAKAQEVLLHGSGGEGIQFEYQRGQRHLSSLTPFEGVLPQLARRYQETASAAVREELEQYMNEQPCPLCHGARLNGEALAVRVGEWSIAQLTSLSIVHLFEALPAIAFPPQEQLIAQRILKEILDRLIFLKDVGLGYLSLGRRASTLSGGEAQRIRLASQIGSRLAGVLYILDEPSIGLHQRDNERLIRTLLRLRDLGNTVVVVEHDSDTILAADHVLDMGPGAGVHGGEVVYNGPVAGLLALEQSLTGGFLSGRLQIPVPATRRKPARGGWLTVKGATANNLKGITVKVPLGVMTCVTGVSGSGKSSLVIETLYKGVLNHLHQGREQAGQCEAITGLDRIDKVIDIDQSPIGRTPRSNPATYTGVLTPVRELLARLPEARARGYQPGRFSFNIKGGRCETCEGEGVIRIAMHFLPDIYVTCDTCGGLRYNHDTLEIKYRGKSIAEILAMTIEEGLDFFSKVPAIRSRLQTLSDVGLSYVSLGQSSVTLSGGEAQRIKLARELGKRGTGRTLYILDEPTTGLHPADIRHLLNVLVRLVEQGNTVVVIEHNLDVIKTADHVID